MRWGCGGGAGSNANGGAGGTYGNGGGGVELWKQLLLIPDEMNGDTPMHVAAKKHPEGATQFLLSKRTTTALAAGVEADGDQNIVPAELSDDVKNNFGQSTKKS